MHLQRVLYQEATLKDIEHIERSVKLTRLVISSKVKSLSVHCVPDRKDVNHDIKRFCKVSNSWN